MDKQCVLCEVGTEFIIHNVDEFQSSKGSCAVLVRLLDAHCCCTGQQRVEAIITLCKCLFPEFILQNRKYEYIYLFISVLDLQTAQTFDT
jgi:hypothetical protein